MINNQKTLPPFRVFRVFHGAPHLLPAQPFAAMILLRRCEQKELETHNGLLEERRWLEQRLLFGCYPDAQTAVISPRNYETFLLGE